MSVELAVGLGLAALALLLAAMPLLRRPAPRTPADDDAVERLVDAAEVALAADAMCARCYASNPEGARFCATCGRRLAGAGDPGEAPA